jgi:hypothetical protein
MDLKHHETHIFRDKTASETSGISKVVVKLKQRIPK